MNNICKLSWNNMIEGLKIIFLNLYLPKILDESLSVDFYEVCVFDNVYNLHQNTSANLFTKVRKKCIYARAVRRNTGVYFFEREDLSLLLKYPLTKFQLRYKDQNL